MAMELLVENCRLAAGELERRCVLVLTREEVGPRTSGCAPTKKYAFKKISAFARRLAPKAQIQGRLRGQVSDTNASNDSKI